MFLSGYFLQWGGGRQKQAATLKHHHNNKDNSQSNKNILLNKTTFNLNVKLACAMKKKWLTSLEEPKPLYSSESNMAAQLSA